MHDYAATLYFNIEMLVFNALVSKRPEEKYTKIEEAPNAIQYT
jgi:hypothetical protein